MVARLNRPTGLPQISNQRVDQPVIQRAVDAITRTLIAVVNFLQPFAQPQPWRDLPYFSDWTRDLLTLQGPQYRKDPLNNVHLRGWVASPAGAVSTIAILPDGCRPPERVSFDAFRLTGGAYSLIRLDVDVDGRVFIAAPAMPGAAIEVSLNGIYFSTEA